VFAIAPGTEVNLGASVTYCMGGDIEYVLVPVEVLAKAKIDPAKLPDAGRKFESDGFLNALCDGSVSLYKATVTPNSVLYVPATFVLFSRILSASGPHNSVHGFRSTFIFKDASAKASLDVWSEVSSNSASKASLDKVVQALKSAMA
jgi:hypothetical protein